MRLGHYSIGFVFPVFFFSTAQATSCADPGDVIKEYPVIFKGKAILTTELQLKDAFGASLADKVSADEKEMKAFIGSYVVTKFEVQEVYKGHVGKEIDVYHFVKGWFGVEYKDGLTYVIFTGKDLNSDDGIEGRIETNLCSPVIFLGENDSGPHGHKSQDLERRLKAYALEKGHKIETVR